MLWKKKKKLQGVPELRDHFQTIKNTIGINTIGINTIGINTRSGPRYINTIGINITKGSLNLATPDIQQKKYNRFKKKRLGLVEVYDRSTYRTRS